MSAANMGNLRITALNSVYEQHFRGRSLSAVAATSGGDSDSSIMFLMFVAASVALYGGLYAFLVRKYGGGTPQRRMTNRFLCCWGDLYTGKAFCLYNIIFSPFVLLLHAVRIYVGSCAHVYARRAFFLAFGCCTSFFTDPEFPPEDASLGQVGGDAAHQEEGKSDAQVTWVRAMDFSKADMNMKTTHPHLHNSDMFLFEGKIEAKDILQGALGDCWLLAAMATLSEHEGAINSLFLTPEVDPRGQYHIRLFDPQESKWKTIVVDDHVPCERDPRAVDGVRRGHDGHPEAQYARPHGKEIWAMLLEKAFAKLCGSYAAIEAGITEWGVVCMTGGNAWRYQITSGNAWERRDLVILDDPRDKRACGFQPADERHDSSELFELLRYYHRHGAVLCCGGVKAAGQAQGLVQKHAFSLLQVRTVRKDWESDHYFRFVQVRNPWGTGEWTGPWSDNSTEWDQYPHVKQQLEFEKGDDGTYWMQWEDFCQYWSYVGCVDMSTDIHSMRPPLHLESEPTGPLKAFFRGCGQFWCLGSGLRHLLMSHQASSKQVASDEFNRTCGMDPSGIYCRVCEQETVHVDRKGGTLIKDPHEIRLFGNQNNQKSSDRDAGVGMAGKQALLGGA
eukprot:CAMPEP_0115212372 /NCGR_PEP_ID=MMETSP0270-20121206/23245_1 /TAXON_ID=71861 /ORGANISM="Scrippsiella trochoidea, Strain CCMP3099" /LENGTH=616 /DNA_ID=CAMNT_0002626089 /DNA_START=53 /DNA_END=1903 /DNA_ORIENTATION=-